MADASKPVLRVFEDAHLNVGTSESTVLDFGADNAGRLVGLTYFGYKRSGGTAATYQPYFGEVAAGAITDLDSKVAYPAAIAVATVTKDQYDPPVVFKLDASGRLYLHPGFDAGADNDGDYEAQFQIFRGS